MDRARRILCQEHSCITVWLIRKPRHRLKVWMRQGHACHVAALNLRTERAVHVPRAMVCGDYLADNRPVVRNAFERLAKLADGRKMDNFAHSWGALPARWYGTPWGR